MARNGGINFQDDGAMDIIVAEPTSADHVQGGFLMNAAGAVFVDATATPAAGDPRRMGFAFTQTGKLYVTKGAVGATGSVQRGIAISVDGAVHVATAEPSTFATQGAWKASTAGVLYVNEL